MEQQTLQRLHEHRAWANQQIWTTVDRLTETELQREFAIGQGSVWKTLTHLYAAEYIWLAALQGEVSPVAPGDLPNQLPGNQQGDGRAESWPELRKRWEVLQQNWSDYLATLSEAELDQPVMKTSSRHHERPPAVTPRRDVLLHVCTHAQYTIAQLVNMLRQLKVAPLPDVMLITMSRAENPS